MWGKEGLSEGLEQKQLIPLVEKGTDGGRNCKSESELCKTGTRGSTKISRWGVGRKGARAEGRNQRKKASFISIPALGP